MTKRLRHGGRLGGADAPLPEGAVLKIASAFCEEGALVEAVEILKGAIARIGPTPKLRAALSHAEFEAGMRMDRPRNETSLPVLGNGVLFVPMEPRGIWAHATVMLGFHKFSVVGKRDSDWKDAEAFAVFDAGFETKGNRLCQRLAEFSGKPIWLLRKNRLTSPENGAFALFVSQGPVSHGSSEAESTGFRPTPQEIREAAGCLELLLENRLGNQALLENIWLALGLAEGSRMEDREGIQTVFVEKFLRGSRYFLEGRGVVGCREYLERVHEAVSRGKGVRSAAGSVGRSSAAEISRPLRVLFVLPSGRYGATGRYVQTLAREMVARGSQVAILADGDLPPRSQAPPRGGGSNSKERDWSERSGRGFSSSRRIGFI